MTKFCITEFAMINLKPIILLISDKIGHKVIVTPPVNWSSVDFMDTKSL